MPTRFWNFAITAAAVTLLAACAGDGPVETADARIGWVDGCNSGFYDADVQVFDMSYYRDGRAYKSSSDYRGAWDAAFKECYEEGLKSGDMTGGGAPGF